MMRKSTNHKALIRKIIAIILPVLLISSGPTGKKDFSAARKNNVCKVLKDDVLLYFVFIDTRTTHPWTEFDILTTIDSIHVAKRWIEEKAAKAGVILNIKTDYYIGNEYTTINRNLPKKDLQESIREPNLNKGIYSLNRWADYVAKTVGESLYIEDKDGIPVTSKPNNKERLIAQLRDDYAVESVALMFFVNNYFRDDISISINTMETTDVEFSIVSYKYPAEISKYFLKLFGGVDLNKSHERKSNRKVKIARQYFPNDIMQDVNAKNLTDLDIGSFTAYMIGWYNVLESKYEPLLTDGVF
ncbi:MAG: hypothetical protein WD577_02060 [Bacteroidales bacterium]